MVVADLIALGVVLLLPVDSVLVRLAFVSVTAIGILVTERFERPLNIAQAMRLSEALQALAAAAAVVSLPLLAMGHSALVTTAVTSAVLIGVRALAAVRLQRVRRRHGGLRTVMVGAGSIADEIAFELSSSGAKDLRPIGFVDRDAGAGHSFGLVWLGSTNQLRQMVADGSVDVIVVAWGLIREAELLPVLRAAVWSGVDVLYVPRFFSLRGATDTNPVIGGIPLQRLRPYAERVPAWKIKRALDVVLSALVIVASAPLLVLIAVAILLTDGGPVLFRQMRIGQHGRVFELFKFRTMATSHDGDRTWRANGSSRDERTPVGRLLRKTSLDEMPQLFNVLRGDMSIVGPRPERPSFVEMFEREIPGYGDRHRLPAGITGWAQINDLRGNTSISRRARFDNAYIDEWRLGLDLRILAKTVSRVCKDVVSTEDRDARGTPASVFNRRRR